LGLEIETNSLENDTIVLDTNYNYSNSNITDITESGGEDESESHDNFSMVMGFGASFGILGFIISVLALREKKNREYSDDDIYIEPVSNRKDNDSHVLVVNENYNDSENMGERQYETICDTLYELAGEKSVY
jgi:hypothetical protein